jgi:uncharacterized protein (TIGR00369 family)
MSGLDFMLGILDGSIAGAPIAGTLNFSLVEVEDGRVVFAGKPEFGALNPAGAVHGGWYGALLDSALGCAVMTKVPKGLAYTTLEYKVNITRALPLGTDVRCEAVIDHAGRSTAVAHATITGLADGKVYATGSTTCIIMKPG